LRKESPKEKDDSEKKRTIAIGKKKGPQGPKERQPVYGGHLNSVPETKGVRKPKREEEEKDRGENPSSKELHSYIREGGEGGNAPSIP